MGLYILKKHNVLFCHINFSVPFDLSENLYMENTAIDVLFKGT